MSLARLGALICLSGLTLALGAQEPRPKTKIEEAWDSILPDAKPSAAVRPAESDFVHHFFFESRTEYWRFNTSFTGLPTVTGVINAPFTGIFNPNGIPYPAAFQPSANRLYSFLDWGTRGWLDDRVNTHFALRYEQDVSHVVPGAPAQGLLETFDANRRVEWVNAAVEFKNPHGWDLQLGRQDVYGAEMVALDGARFTLDRRVVAVTLFGGRRFSFFTDAEQRAIGGANAVFRLTRNASVEVQTLWYIKGENTIAYRQRIGTGWLFSTYFRAYGGAPVDFSTQGIYSPGMGKTSIRLSFFQKLTNRDYIYDYTSSTIPRLYLGPISPHTQFSMDANRTVTSRLRLGAAVWVRRLNNNNDQGPFDTSFQDYRAHANLVPVRRVMASFEYHQHDSGRLNPANATLFDDVSRSGETSVKDLTAQLTRTFGEGRLSLNGGAYYRRISMQDRFYVMNGLHQSGWLAGAGWRMDRRTRIYGDYNLDNDFFLFYPSIKNSRALRVGIDWKY